MARRILQHHLLADLHMSYEYRAETISGSLHALALMLADGWLQGWGA